MKPKLLLLSFLITSTCFAQLKIDKQHFVDLLKQGKYSECFNEAIKLRKQQYGKCCTVDYFIAKALCGDKHYPNADKMYANILKDYKLNDANREFIENEKNNCKASSTAGEMAASNFNMSDFNRIMSFKMPEGEVRGKGGPIEYNCDMPPQEFTNVREIGEAEMQSRLFNINETNQAIKKYETMLGDNYNINISGRFILITYGNTVIKDEQANQIGKRLERTYNFFCQHYNLSPPEKLIAVYLMPGKNVMSQTAQLIHGIKIPETNLGYSNITDLSLVGISDTAHLGTLCHELFHLILHTDIGDAPPWLDEGLASVYEQNHWDGNVLKGTIHNWRTEVLASAGKSMPQRIPKLKEFINFSWREFDGFESNDICKASINYSYGRTLMIYFQETGILPALVTAVKTRNTLSNDFNIVPQTDVELIEKTVGKNIATIEKEFDNWRATTYTLKQPETSNSGDDYGGQVQVVPMFPIPINISGPTVKSIKGSNKTGIYYIWKTSNTDWTEQDPKGKLWQFTQTSSDDCSVYLTSVSKSHSLEIDICRNAVIYTNLQTHQANLFMNIDDNDFVRKGK